MSNFSSLGRSLLGGLASLAALAALSGCNSKDSPTQNDAAVNGAVSDVTSNAYGGDDDRSREDSRDHNSAGGMDDRHQPHMGGMGGMGGMDMHGGNSMAPDQTPPAANSSNAQPAPMGDM